MSERYEQANCIDADFAIPLRKIADGVPSGFIQEIFCLSGKAFNKRIRADYGEAPIHSDVFCMISVFFFWIPAIARLIQESSGGVRRVVYLEDDTRLDFLPSDIFSRHDSPNIVAGL